MRNNCFFLLILLVSCGSKESFQPTFPIPIKDYYYSKSGNQLIFTIEFENEIPTKLSLENLYFQGQKLVQQETKSNQVQFKIDSKPFVLDGETSNEYGNQPPLSQNLPFKIALSEAVLTYKMNNQVQHYKFKNVVERANL